MNQEQNPVVFRRIRGRVVPIRISKDAQKSAAEIGKGIGLAGLGTAASVAAGLASANLDLRAHKLHGFVKSFESRAAGFWKSGRGTAAVKAMKASEAAVERASRAARFGTRIGQVGAVVGASLIGAGIHKLLGQTPLKDDDQARAAASTAGAVASQFALRNVYNTKFFRDVKGLQAIRETAKLAIKKGLRFL